MENLKARLWQQCLTFDKRRWRKVSFPFHGGETNIAENSFYLGGSKASWMWWKILSKAGKFLCHSSTRWGLSDAGNKYVKLKTRLSLFTVISTQPLDGRVLIVQLFTSRNVSRDLRPIMLIVVALNPPLEWFICWRTFRDVNKPLQQREFLSCCSHFSLRVAKANSHTLIKVKNIETFLLNSLSSFQLHGCGINFSLFTFKLVSQCSVVTLICFTVTTCYYLSIISFKEKCNKVYVLFSKIVEECRRRFWFKFLRWRAWRWQSA